MAERCLRLAAQRLYRPGPEPCSAFFRNKSPSHRMKNLKPKRVAAACVIPSTSSKEKLLRKSASIPKPARFLRTPKKAPIRTEFQAGTVGKLHGRNDLNAMSRRSKWMWRNLRSNSEKLKLRSLNRKRKKTTQSQRENDAMVLNRSRFGGTTERLVTALENSVHQPQKRTPVCLRLWQRLSIPEQLNRLRWKRQPEGDEDCSRVAHWWI